MCKDWQEEGKSMGRGQWEVFAKGGKTALSSSGSQMSDSMCHPLYVRSSCVQRAFLNAVVRNQEILKSCQVLVEHIILV